MGNTPLQSKYKPSQEIAFLNSKQIEQGEIPFTYYKYWPISSAIRFLTSGQIMFNRFIDFNDPFECKAEVDAENSETEWLGFLKYNGLDDISAQREAKCLTGNKEKAKAIIDKSIESVKNDNGIFCLTTKPDNLLMWAHYADCHKGCCIEFDVRKDVNAFCPISKVSYSQYYIKDNYLRNHKMVLDSFLQKSIEWEYENEYRIMHEHGVGLMNVNMESVVSIIIGCRTSTTDKSAIQEVLKDKGLNHISLKHAKIHSSSYSLDII